MVWYRGGGGAATLNLLACLLASVFPPPLFPRGFSGFACYIVLPPPLLLTTLLIVYAGRSTWVVIVIMREPSWLFGICPGGGRGYTLHYINIERERTILYYCVCFLVLVLVGGGGEGR